MVVCNGARYLVVCDIYVMCENRQPFNRKGVGWCSLSVDRVTSDETSVT